MTDNLLTADLPETIATIPQGIPVKFWDEDKAQIRTDALLASYLALEKKFSQTIPYPQTDDDRRQLHGLLGCPNQVEEYNVMAPSEFIAIDPVLNARLHQKGFTNEQLQEVYNLAAEHLVPMILQMASEFQADREIERLVEYFGSAERWQEISRQLHDYGCANLPPLAFEGMACSYDGIMALYQMMKADNALPRVSGAATSTDVLDEASLKKLMQDPKYWREKNPHFIAKVSAGFEKLYRGT